MSAVMQQPITPLDRKASPFAFERLAMDRWAVWRETGFLDCARPQHILARLQEMGDPNAPSGYGWVPEFNDTGERVQVFMAALARDEPKIHLCLEARHRWVVGAIYLGLKKDSVTGKLRRYFDNEIAEAAVGPGKQALDRYRYRCDQGYLRLRSWMKR